MISTTEALLRKNRIVDGQESPCPLVVKLTFQSDGSVVAPEGSKAMVLLWLRVIYCPFQGGGYIVSREYFTVYSNAVVLLCLGGILPNVPRRLFYRGFG